MTRCWSGAQQSGSGSRRRGTARDVGGPDRARRQVRFLHPLAFCGLRRRYAAERQAAHRALAEATDAAADPDRRARHLAQATPGPTRTSPPSWSARPAARRPAAAWRRVPPSRASRRPDARSGAEGATSAGRGAIQAPGRGARRGSAPADDGAGGSARRAGQARPHCCTRRSRSRDAGQRCPSAAARRRSPARGHSMRRSRARRTSTRSPPRCQPTVWCTAAMRAMSPRRSSPPSGSRRARVRLPARRARPPDDRGLRRRAPA